MTDEEQIYICAVRYGLGRRTYITSTISDFLCSKKLSEKTQLPTTEKLSSGKTASNS